MTDTSRRLGNKKKWEQLEAFLFLLPAIVFFVATKYVPIIQGFFISFFDIDIVNLPGKFVGFDNYIHAFKDPMFYQALLHNVKFFVYHLLMGFWPPILLALLINEVGKGKTFMRLMYFLPAIAPAMAITVLFKFVWQPDYGLANNLLSNLGIAGKLWLNDESLVYFCMNLPSMLLCGGMNMIIYLAAMQDIPNEQYEAALMYGAGFLRRAWKITLPQIKNVIVLMFVLASINSFNMIDTPMVMTGGGPAGSTETMILYAYKQALNYNDYSYAITMANIVFVIIFIITAIQLKLENNNK